MTLGEFKKLKKFFTDWGDMREIVTYQVEENFINHTDTYKVININADLEDGVVWLYDIDDVILNRSNSTKGFLISSAELVRLCKNNFLIKLKDGTISVRII